MNIKYHLVKLAEKITGRKCCRCAHNCGGKCKHPVGFAFSACWQSLGRPGFEPRQPETPAQETGDLTQEELYQLEQIVTSVQEAGQIAKDGGLLEDDEKDGNWPAPW